MTVDEAKRHELYNVLTETIGTEETETFMALLPKEPAGALATKVELESVRTDLTDRIEGVRTDLTDRIDGVNRRLDRLFLTLAAGLLAIVGSVVVQALS